MIVSFFPSPRPARRLSYSRCCCGCCFSYHYSLSINIDIRPSLKEEDNNQPFSLAERLRFPLSPSRLFVCLPVCLLFLMMSGRFGASKMMRLLTINGRPITTTTSTNTARYTTTFSNGVNIKSSSFRDSGYSHSGWLSRLEACRFVVFVFIPSTPPSPHLIYCRIKLAAWRKWPVRPVTCR